MKIKETNLQFGSLRTRSSTKRIIVHHSASLDVSAAKIHRWHLARGWSGIGYHYVIRANGTVERGRPEYAIGAHAGSAGNPDSIGICLTGNFSIEEPGAVQVDSLVELIEDIQERYGRLELLGHCDLMATECPGDKFPWKELYKKLVGESMEEKVPCTINIKGKEFPGYVLKGNTFFDGADVTDVITALNSSWKWDEKNLTVKVS